MKKIGLTIVLFLLVFSTIFAQTYSEIIDKASAAYHEKDYETSWKTYKKAFKLDANRSDLYNAACSAALAKQNRLAYKWLNASIEKGWTNLQHLKTDSDLNNLHGTKKWSQTIAFLEEKLVLIEANYDKPLRAELLKILDEDQKYRKMTDSVETQFGRGSEELRALWKTINEKDSLNLISVCKIIDEHGWVGISKVGNEGALALFLVIQHADTETQAKYIPLLREAVKKKEANPSNLALMEDRLALGQGKPQIYGSQVWTIPNPETGIVENFIPPIIDPDNVDKRRAEVGLGTLASYYKYFKIEWDLEAYKKDLPEIEQKFEMYRPKK